MSTLASVFPRDELVQRLGLPVRFEEYTHQQPAELAAHKGYGMFALAMNIWNRIVQRRLKHVDPMALGPHVQREDPMTYLAIERLIAEPAVYELFYLRGLIDPPIDDQEEVVEFFIGHVYPGELILEDVSIIDPRKPIPDSQRKSQIHVYRGAGLLPIVMRNLETCARELDCSSIVLTAAMASNVPLFRRFGFEVEQNDFARECLRLGVTIPMEKRL